MTLVQIQTITDVLEFLNMYQILIQQMCHHNFIKDRETMRHHIYDDKFLRFN